MSGPGEGLSVFGDDSAEDPEEPSYGGKPLFADEVPGRSVPVPPQSGPAACPACGAELAATDLYCPGCGHALSATRSAGGAAIASEPLPVYAESWRTRLAPIGWVAATVIGLALVGGAIWVLLGPGGSPQQSAAPPAPEPPPATDAANDQPVQCWDGSTATECPPITGEAGMSWAFHPTIESNDCSPGELDQPQRNLGKVMAIVCTLQVDGRSVVVTFSEFTDLATGLAYYGRPGYIGAPDRVHAGVHVWDPQEMRGSWRATRMLTDLPFSFTIGHADRAVVEAALDAVQVRSEAERSDVS